MKNILLPTLTTEHQKYVMKYENTPIANITIKTVSVDGDGKIIKKIDAFYKRMTKKFADWVNVVFRAYAEKSYHSDTNPRKKYRFCPLGLCYETSEKILENKFLSVEIVITLSREGKLVGKKRINHLWDLSKGVLRK